MAVVGEEGARARDAGEPWPRTGVAVRLADALEAERDRWFYWIPVLVGAGIALFFQLPAEPGLMVSLAPLAVVAALWLAGRGGFVTTLVTGALLALCLGFAVAKVRTDSVAAPILERQLRNVEVSGWVELVEPKPSRGERLTIRVARLGSLPNGATPYRIRVRTLQAHEGLRPGDPVRLIATLSPPGGPPLPGGYDFGRSAYYQRIGAVGYALKAAEIDPSVGDPPLRLHLAARIERLRQAIGARVTAALAGETGAIANALLTGERNAISDATNDAFRDSGLFHILSISGLHMSMMAGAVFISVRLLLALSATLALTFPIKKWAAAAAALAALGYLLISGSSSATLRSYLMISVMFLAILLDRPAIALRNVAIAALAILLVTPEALHDVGFQMSFAAVVSLVSAYDWLRERRRGRDEHAPRGGVARMALMFLGGIVLTTIIASLAVAPFAAYHFHKGQQYAVLANLIAIPLCNVLVMPAALAAFVAMPFGLEFYPLQIMGLGVDGMVWCARSVAALPGAVSLIPAMPTAAFAWMVMGGLWLTLWRARWRLLGFAPIAIGLALAPNARRPDVIAARDGALVAARVDAGRLSALKGRGAQFELTRWLEHDGDARSGREVASGAGFRCDRVGCIATVRGKLVAMPFHAAGLRDDCRKADVLILRWPKPRGCDARGAVIDLQAFRDQGVHALSVVDGVVKIETVAGARGHWPWSLPHQRMRRHASGTRIGSFAAPHDVLSVKPADLPRLLADEAAGGD